MFKLVAVAVALVDSFPDLALIVLAAGGVRDL
jgi:hypothetical protein